MIWSVNFLGGILLGFVGLSAAWFMGRQSAKAQLEQLDARLQNCIAEIEKTNVEIRQALAKQSGDETP